MEFVLPINQENQKNVSTTQLRNAVFNLMVMRDGKSANVDLNILDIPIMFISLCDKDSELVKIPEDSLLFGECIEEIEADMSRARYIINRFNSELSRNIPESTKNYLKNRIEFQQIRINALESQVCMVRARQSLCSINLMIKFFGQEHETGRRTDQYLKSRDYYLKIIALQEENLSRISKILAKKEKFINSVFNVQK